MGRRDPDPRPSIEIVGVPSTVESVQQVSTGPGGPRRSWARPVALSAGVALLLVGGLALGGDDDQAVADRKAPGTTERSSWRDRTTTTRRTTTTTRPTTTTTTIPVGPVFGEPVGAGLLVFGQRGWELVNLDTGGRVRLDLPSDSPWDAVSAPGGVVLVDYNTREAYFHPIGPFGAVEQPVLIGAADQVLPSERADRVWLVDREEGEYQADGTSTGEVTVSLVDLRGQVVRSFMVTSQAYISRGVEQGVVFERAGRVYLADEGGVHPIAVGTVQGLYDGDLLLLACDDGAVCTMKRQPVDGSPSTQLDSLPVEDGVGYETAAASDGRVILISYEGEGARALFLSAADGLSLNRFEEASGSYYSGPPRWLPGNAGLVAPQGTQVQWLREVDGDWSLHQPLALQDLQADTVFVIDW